MTEISLKSAYDKVKQLCNEDWKSIAAGDAILDLVTISLRFLNDYCHITDLVSKVPGKAYFTFQQGNVFARPVNREFFIVDPDTVGEFWGEWYSGQIAPGNFTKLSYTVALAPCLAMEILDRQNKKGPATFFECYVGHLFAKSLGVNPSKKAILPVHGRPVRLTMDFLFDLGEKHPKVHLPVKMSTRERVVQAWSHQRLLDSAYGKGAFHGVMVLFSETKLDLKSHEVVEICVPDQWLTYQTLLAQMDRIYYFDIPERYQALTNSYPDVIVIKQFAEFFKEIDEVVRS